MLLGLICILLSGLTTIGFGVIFNYIGTKYDFKNTMLMYAVLTLFLCAGISFFESGSWATFAILPMLFAFLSGVCNIIGLIAMQKAMSIGNAGVAWAFCQAGLLGPFLFSIVYYGERPSLLQYAGALVILFGMVILSSNDSNEDASQAKNKLFYLICIFSSFLFACVNGSFVVVVSKIAPEFDISLRAMFVYIGTVLTLAIILGYKKSYKLQITKGVLLSVVGLATFGLGSSALMFIGSNCLAKVNLASIAIPILQGTAIGGFALYSTFVLKEKCTLIKWGGIILIILGIVFMSF